MKSIMFYLGYIPKKKITDKIYEINADYNYEELESDLYKRDVRRKYYSSEYVRTSVYNALKELLR